MTPLRQLSEHLFVLGDTCNVYVIRGGDHGASFITGADLPVDGGYLTVGGEGATLLDLHDD